MVTWLSYMQLGWKVLHVVNQHLHASWLPCVLVKLGDSTGDCHMTQYDIDIRQIVLSIDQTANVGNMSDAAQHNLLLKARILYPPPPPPAGEWLQDETINGWSLTTFWLNWINGLLSLINNMVTELIRPVSYNPGSSQKLIKLEISSCRCSQLECNEKMMKLEVILSYILHSCL